MHIFIQGIIFGFLIAVPVGPIGLLCINRALSGGAAYGLVSGLGVAAADALAAAIAAMGLTLISNVLFAQQLWLRPLGGVFLCYLGVRVFMTRPIAGRVEPQADSFLGAFASTFLLTISNPVTLLSFLAIYAGWGVEGLGTHYLSAAVLTSGVFVGSFLWWIFLAIGLVLFRDRFNESGLRWVHRVSGVIIAGFGLIVLVKPY